MWPWRRKGSTSSRRAGASGGKSDAREKLSQAKKDAHEKLVRACDDGDVVVVRELLATGAVNINKKDKQSFYGYTPLHWAASKGHGQIVEVLLCAGATPNATDKDRWTPLHWAAWRGHRHVVDLLVRAGASLDPMDQRGVTPLYNASSNGHAQIVELLLQEAVERSGRPLNDRAALHVACRNSHKEVANALLVYGADLFVADSKGYTPLHQCMLPNQPVSDSMMQTLHVLVSFGAIWDPRCDEALAGGKLCSEAPALRVCMMAWAREHTEGAPFTVVPIETIKQGAASTQNYIDERQTPQQVVLCVDDLN